MVSRSTPEAGVSAHALRPRGTRAQAVDIVRHARIVGRGSELIVRDRYLREHRYAVGQGGIVRAVFIPPTDPAAGAKRLSADRWGVVDFQGADGQAIVRVPLGEWLPEAGLIGLIDLSPKECLDRTGLRTLVAELGIPLEEKAESADSSAVATDSGARPDRAVHRELPVWHNWVRGIGALVWFVFFLVIPMTGSGNRGTAVTAVVGLLLIPTADLVALYVFWLRNRRSAALFEGAETIAPSPEPRAGATRRFCDTAVVRILPGDVVLTNTLGEERWVSRGGAHGVTRLVRLLDPSSGAVLGVDFRDRGNATRALLPWQWWFAGPAGSEAWSRLVAALGVPVSDEKVKRGQSADPWWRGHGMATDARRMSPIPAKKARQATSWHSSVVGSGEPIVVPLFSVIPLIGLTSDRSLAQVAGALAALTIVFELAPVISHQLLSRFKLDRPVGPESP